LEAVALGEEVAISYPKNIEPIAVIIPYQSWKNSGKRKLGTLKGKASVTFADNFSMTDEELLSQ
jgi:antitoxin (DNA-binding transcriptional repressor) of toxin-antitoxin stability system